MDTGLNIRPVQTSSSVPVRSEPAPVRQVARTELPETQVVLATSDSQSVQVDKTDEQTKLVADINKLLDAKAAAPQRTVEQDPTTRELVFRTISSLTGQVVSQFPDDALLRQRAYAINERRAELEKALAPLSEKSV